MQSTFGAKAERISDETHCALHSITYFLEKFLPLPGLKPGISPGSPRYQANMLPTELSWLGCCWLTVNMLNLLFFSVAPRQEPLLLGGLATLTGGSLLNLGMAGLHEGGVPNYNGLFRGYDVTTSNDYIAGNGSF